MSVSPLGKTFSIRPNRPSRASTEMDGDVTIIEPFDDDENARLDIDKQYEYLEVLADKERLRQESEAEEEQDHTYDIVKLQAKLTSSHPSRCESRTQSMPSSLTTSRNNSRPSTPNHKRNSEYLPEEEGRLIESELFAFVPNPSTPGSSINSRRPSLQGRIDKMSDSSPHSKSEKLSSTDMIWLDGKHQEREIETLKAFKEFHQHAQPRPEQFNSMLEDCDPRSTQPRVTPPDTWKTSKIHQFAKAKLTAKMASFSYRGYNGEKFIKHGRWGKPHKVTILMTSVGRDLTIIRLTWGPGKKYVELSKENKAYIVAGKETTNFERSVSSNAPVDHCFSVVIPNERTLDLEAPDQMIRNQWVEGLSLYLRLMS